MRSGITWIVVIITIIMVSCKKEHSAIPGTIVPDPVNPAKKVLLKDITIPLLPSPFYHFEYREDSIAERVSFGSGFTMYDVFYDGNRISEMRDNIVVNHDTLRYVYDNTGKVTRINFIDEANVIYRHVNFSYSGELVREIDWDHLDGVNGFIIDRTLTFTYFGDGNAKEIREHRPVIGGQPELNLVTQFDQYDDKINVDDFMLLHDGIHDHLFLLPPGLRIQKNNPRKETRTGDGDNYTINNTYTYKSDGTPLIKSGDLLFTKAPKTGQTFQLTTNYSYY
jgi:hypothetical protein